MLVKRKRRKGPGQEGLITASPFLMPSLIGLLVFSLLPLLISAFISLTDWNGLDQLTAPGFFQEHFIGLDNYKAILSSPEFWGVLWNTFRYIIMYIPLMLVASLGVAYLLSRQRPGVTAFRIIYYIPVLTSWVAASMIWKSMLPSPNLIRKCSGWRRGNYAFPLMSVLWWRTPPPESWPQMQAAFFPSAWGTPPRPPAAAPS